MKFRIGTILVISVTAFLLTFSILSIARVEDNVAITVTDKAVKRSVESDTYMIFTEAEVFECSDSLWDWKFNSSDFYGKLQIGKTYKVKVRGIRIPFMSMYRNIVCINELIK